MLRCPRCGKASEEDAEGEGARCEACGTELLAEGAPPIARDAGLAGRVIELERFRGSLEAERALIPLLDRPGEGVRDATVEALVSSSGGESPGYEPDADPEARRSAVTRRWERVGGKPA